MQARKRVFIGLVGLILLALLIALSLVISFSWWDSLAKILSFLVITILIGLLVFAGFGLLAMVYMIKTGKKITMVKVPLRLVVDFFYPLSLQVGKLFRVPREKIQSSFVAVNNALVQAGVQMVESREILILMPHCIQLADCNHKITVDVNNCRRCGRCQVSELLELSRDYGVGLAVATGGGMARRIIQERHPRAVVAVACERDLTSGLQETFPLPVYGVINIRPEGYCLNTKVDMNKIRAALDMFLQGKPVGEIQINQEVAASKN